MSRVTRSRPPLGMIELKVQSVALDVNAQPVVMLTDRTGKRSLPISIGPAEAVAISLALEGQSLPRPMTHDLLCSLLTEVGVKVERVIICDMREMTYYARLVIRSGGETREIDCRPSDGIAIALRVKVPVMIGEELLTRIEAEHRIHESRGGRGIFVVDPGEGTIH